MVVKIIQWAGILACIILCISCFLPWVYIHDGRLQENFTGFYSFQNYYGRPGKYLLVMGVVAMVFMLLPKLWAKRTNLFLCALVTGYAIKNYIVFSSCYNNYCPEKQAGIYLMLCASIVMLVAAIFPQLKVPVKNDAA